AIPHTSAPGPPFAFASSPETNHLPTCPAAPRDPPSFPTRRSSDLLGTRYSFGPELLVPDAELSFWTGAIPLIGPVNSMGRWRKHIYTGVAKTLGIDLKKPWRALPEEHRDWLLYGAGDRHITYEWKQRHGVWKHGGTWEGIIP